MHQVSRLSAIKGNQQHQNVQAHGKQAERQVLQEQQQHPNQQQRYAIDKQQWGNDAQGGSSIDRIHQGVNFPPEVDEPGVIKPVQIFEPKIVDGQAEQDNQKFHFRLVFVYL